MEGWKGLYDLVLGRMGGLSGGFRSLVYNKFQIDAITHCEDNNQSQEALQLRE